jgi:hypothetical protein
MVGEEHPYGCIRFGARGITVFMTITLLCGINAFHIIMIMSMAMSVAVTVRMIVEQSQSQNIRQQASTSNDADQFRILHLLRLHQSLYRFQENG